MQICKRVSGMSKSMPRKALHTALLTSFMLLFSSLSCAACGLQCHSFITHIDNANQRLRPCGMWWLEGGA